MIRDFGLREQTQKHDGIFYRKLPVLGHFGDNGLELPWERLDKAELLADKR
jgi:S-adenosylmethionine synthetase